MTTDCPCDDPPKRLLRIPAGLPTLPRQTQAFPEERIALLVEVARTPELDGWQARGERDFGVMWLEMWAYVADVLGFYDERISNESYIRTAVRRPSLRRIVDLLGYIPAPGVAGSAVIAAIAEGRTPVPIRASTAFRSDAFGDEPPQVFETLGPISAHAFANSWEIGAVAVPTVGPASTSTSSSSSTPSGSVRSDLVFETQNFGLAKDRIVLFQLDPSNPPEQRLVRKVTGVGAFEGKDGRTYATVQLDSSVDIPVDADLAKIKVLTPTVTARITSNLPPRDPPDNSDKDVRLARIVNVPSIDQTVTRVFLDSIYRQLRIGEPVIAAAAETLLEHETPPSMRAIPAWSANAAPERRTTRRRVVRCFPLDRAVATPAAVGGRQLTGEPPPAKGELIAPTVGASSQAFASRASRQESGPRSASPGTAPNAENHQCAAFGSRGTRECAARGAKRVARRVFAQTSPQRPR